MLQTWTMATPKITGIAERGGSPVESEGAGPLAVLDEAGFVGTLASNSEFEIVRYLRLGDVVSATTVVESISDEKQTRLGPGHFVTWVTTYTDAAGEVVGRQTLPHPQVQARRVRRVSTRLAPSVTPDTQFFWDGVKEHKLLIQRCRGCGVAAPPAAARCARTATRSSWDTIEASGRGTVFSFVMPQHPPFPWFEYPYIVALVELEEGSRLVTNLVGDRTRRRHDRHAGRGVLRAVRRRARAAAVPSGRGGSMSTATPTETLDWHDVHVGDELPALVIDVTATRIVAGAIASRDFMPVHHDRDYANTQGAPDIFMNILSDTGYCSRFLTDWAGPDAMIKKLAIRLGVPVFPGHTLTYTGAVTATSLVDGDEASSRSSSRAVNELGEHVTGTAVLGLPVRGAGA